MKTTTAAAAAAAAALVPLPLVPPAPGPIALGDRLRRPGLRRLDPQLRPRAQAEAPRLRDPGPQRRLPAAALTLRAAHHPAGSIARLFAPETLS